MSSPSRSDSAKAFFRKLAVPMARGGVETTEGLAPPSFGHLEMPEPERRLAEDTSQKVMMGQELSRGELFALEAIIIPDKRPTVSIDNGKYEVNNPDWLKLNTDPVKKTIENVLASIGRIEVNGYPGLPYGGTGFVVGNDLVMTNRHVAELFAKGIGESKLLFINGRGSNIDFEHDPESDGKQLLHVRQIKLIHPFWDMALLQVEGPLGPHKPLSLVAEYSDNFSGTDVAVVGYPAFDPRNPSDVQQKVFGGVYNVKRLSPGKLGERRSVSSFGNDVLALTHDASTLGGNSGSAVIDLLTGCIVGLHFAGIYLDANFAVPAWELARDARVVDSGVNFEGPSRKDSQATKAWWASVAGSVESSPLAIVKPKRLPVASVIGGKSTGVATALGEPVTWTIPIEITVRVGTTVADAVQYSSALREAVIATQKGDLDPAAPRQGEQNKTVDLMTARQLANLGAIQVADAGADVQRVTPDEGVALQTLAVDIAQLRSFLNACETSSPRVTYGLGAKVPFPGAVPGRDFTKIDCSGFVREAVRRSTEPMIAFPDGSVVQHDWIIARGFEKISVDAAFANDSVIRIAFLRPQDTESNIGHVTLIYNGRTIESHGRVGPDSRPWDGKDWQAQTSVYMISGKT